MRNKVKPTIRQRKAFENINNAMKKREALLAAGYSPATAHNPGKNFIDTPGYKALISEYRTHLTKAGITPEILADIQAEGLFDQNAAIRLGYLKETKKDLGISVETDQGINQTNIQIVFGRGESEAD